MTVIDDYLAGVDPAMREECERIRAIAHRLLPGAEETISYRMPTIKWQGKSIIAFDAHRAHVGIYPFSGSVISAIPALERYDSTPGAIREKLDDLLPDALVEEVIRERVRQAGVGPV